MWTWSHTAANQSYYFFFSLLTQTVCWRKQVNSTVSALKLFSCIKIHFVKGGLSTSMYRNALKSTNIKLFFKKIKILRQILNGFHWDPVTLFLIWNDNLIATRSRSHDQELLWGSLYIFLEFYYTDRNTWDTLKSQTYCKEKMCTCLHIWQTKWSLHLPPAAVNIFYKYGFLISRLQHTLTITRIISPALIPASDLLTQSFIHISVKPPNEHLSGVLGRKLTILDNFGPQHQTLQ